MSWKDRFDKANSHIKDSIKQKTSDKIDLAKNKIAHSNAAQFANQKGLKNKAAFLGKSALNKAKNTNAAKKLQNAAKKAAKAAQFIASNIVPISIICGVLVFGSNLAIMVVGITQAVGETPHYYCETDPSDSVKQSKEYKQYCENETSFMKFSDIDGHYVVQDGAGPCCSCAMLNMLIRFYYANGINIYDYLWQSDGKYAPIGNSILTDNSAQYNLRLFITGNISENTDPWRAKLGVNGSKDFAKSHGKNDYTMANWGYLRDPTINNSEGYGDLSTNENWVWDLSLENDAPGTGWEAQWYSGNNVTIEGTTATIVHESRAIRSINEFKILLNAHPAGIVVYREYTPGNNHAILVTGYDESTGRFTVVDPARGFYGGFEHDADECVSGGGVTIYNNDILSDPSGTAANGCNHMMSFTYIEEG